MTIATVLWLESGVRNLEFQARRAQLQEGEQPYLPNHACWSPWTSMAKPKSASFTAAPLDLLAKSKFSGFI